MKQHTLYFATPEALQAAQPEPLALGQALLIQVYLTGDSELWQAPLCQFLQQYYPQACVTGITSYGQFQHEQHYRDGLLLQLVGFNHTHFSQCLLPADIDEDDIIQRISQLITAQTKVVLVFSANQNDKHADLLPILSQQRPEIQVAGALAVPQGSSLSAAVFHQHGCEHVGVVLTALHSEQLQAQTLIKSNWFAVGKPLLVNKASHHVISEIDGMSVRQLYKRYLGETAAKYLPAASSKFPLWMEDGKQQSAAFVVKALPDGSAIFNKKVPQGQFVRLSFADMNSLLQNDYLQQSPPVPASLAMIFSCGGRYDILRDTIQQEISPIAQHIPTAGCFGFGEIGMDKDGQAALFSHSMVTLFLTEEAKYHTFTIMQEAELERGTFELTTNELLRVYNNLTKALMEDLAESNAALLKLSHYDHLTGIANRHYLDQTLQSQWQLFHRHHTPCSLLLLDIDHFKKINDRFGHLHGDKVLCELAALLDAHCRTEDTAGRWGGEEFLVICPSTTQAEAVMLAERIRQSVSALTIATSEGNCSFTISIGVAEFAPGWRVDDLLRAADTKLYQAKARGRNLVVV